jgi:hypothetical protein
MRRRRLKSESGEIELIGSILAWILLTMPLIEIRPEIIDVYSRGSIVLTDGFDCRDIKRSSIIERVCYLEKRHYLVVNIKGTYRQYCEVSVSTYAALMGAFSMGHYFQKEIDPGSNHDRYACGSRSLV